jgi:hypothetical protein
VNVRSLAGKNEAFLQIWRHHFGQAPILERHVAADEQKAGTWNQPGNRHRCLQKRDMILYGVITGNVANDEGVIRHVQLVPNG